MLARFTAAHAIALALAMALAPSPAAGQTRSKTTSTKKRTSTTGAPAAPAPATSLGVTPPSPAPAPLPIARPSMPVVQASAPGVRAAGLIGLASPQGNGGDASLMVQAEASSTLRTTDSGLTLSWALPVRGIVLSSKKVAGVEGGGYALEATPTFRASMPLGSSKFSLRTDVGLGFVARWTWSQADVQFVGRVTDTSQDNTGILRLGVALEWALRPGLSLLFEPLTFGWDLDGNADWIFAGGASYRL